MCGDDFVFNLDQTKYNGHYYVIPYQKANFWHESICEILDGPIILPSSNYNTEYSWFWI